ncbi:hypothetical protein J6590_074870 [Homalodisca vitripennis]|nr:hypothetical protein J6590_074870 [Homalodisca vitripennis]
MVRLRDAARPYCLQAPLGQEKQQRCHVHRSLGQSRDRYFAIDSCPPVRLDSLFFSSTRQEKHWRPRFYRINAIFELKVSQIGAKLDFVAVTPTQRPRFVCTAPDLAAKSFGQPRPRQAEVFRLPL